MIIFMVYPEFLIILRLYVRDIQGITLLIEKHQPYVKSCVGNSVLVSFKKSFNRHFYIKTNNLEKLLWKFCIRIEHLPS